MPTNFSYSPTGACYEPTHIEQLKAFYEADSILNRRGQFICEYPNKLCKVLGLYPKLVFKPF